MTETNKPNIPSKQEIADNLQSKAQAASSQLKDKGSEQLREYESQAAGSMESVAEAAQRAADSLGESNQTMLSNYVSELATGISDLASSLRNKNTDEILQDVGRLARNNAGLFLLGSVAIGFGLARIAKADQSHSEAEEGRGWEGYYGVGTSDYDDSYERSGRSSAPASGRQSSFSETDTDVPATTQERSASPETHADTSYLPEAGSGGPTTQQSTAGASIPESRNKPQPGSNVQRPV